MSKNQSTFNKIIMNIFKYILMPQNIAMIAILLVLQWVEENKPMRICSDSSSV